jgi:nucleoside-diphosphate-sugar epimerase
MSMRTVVVAGVSGVVGYAAARRFAAQPDTRVIGLARRLPDGLDGVELHSVDLMDPSACEAFVASLAGEVTHLAYAALFEMPGLVPGWFEREQMDTNLAMLRNLFEPLVGSSPLQHVSLLQGTKAYGAHVEPMRVPGREREPRHQHANFYWLQEDYLREQQTAAGFGLTIWRPVFIFGESIGSHMNAVPAIGVYAALQRAAGQPLHYPGGVAPLFEAVDADLLADAMVWAADEPTAHDETFNITNGDVFTLRNVWPAIADAFGMEAGDDVPCSLGATMPGRHDEWAAVVDRHRLAAPVDLAAFVGQSFIYADLISGYGATEAAPPALLSTIKLRQAGFGACIDTEDMFQRIIGRYQSRGLLPPVGRLADGRAG